MYGVFIFIDFKVFLMICVKENDKVTPFFDPFHYYLRWQTNMVRWGGFYYWN